MERRLQTINGDTILEITHDAPTKTRLSENNLLRTKERLERSITNFQKALTEVEAQLAMITEAKDEEAKR